MSTEPAANALEQPTAAPETVESAPTQATETAAPVETQKPESEPEWFTKRFGEITAKFRGEERARQAAEARAYQLEQQLSQQRQPVAPEKPKTLADFEYDESKFQEYVLGQAEKRAEAAARRVREEEQQRGSAERRARKFQERAVAFEKQTPDFREVAHYAPISDQVAEIIQELEAGPEIAYYLGKNRDIALTLNDLPPSIAAVELGRIDAKLSHEKAAKSAALEAAKAAKAVTQAPPPPPQIEGTNAQVQKDPSEMSDAEFAKWRKKQIEQRRYR